MVSIKLSSSLLKQNKQKIFRTYISINTQATHPSPPNNKKKIAYIFTKTIKILYPVMKHPWFLTTQKRTQLNTQPGENNSHERRSFTNSNKKNRIDNSDCRN